MGGDTLWVEASARDGTGLDRLLEAIALQGELMELRAEPSRPARGVVLDARVDRGRGRCATLLVQDGSLRPGDIVTVGSAWGRARTLLDEQGKPMKEAGPSCPVEVWGLNGEPEAGDAFYAVESEARAVAISEHVARRRASDRDAANKRARSVGEMFAASERREARFIVKAAAQGGADALSAALAGRVDADDALAATPRTLLAAAGPVRESDVDLASVAQAHILAFGVPVEPGARRRAATLGLTIHAHPVIYDLLTAADEIIVGASGERAPETRQLGRAEVREVFYLVERASGGGGVHGVGWRLASELDLSGVARRGVDSRGQGGVVAAVSRVGAGGAGGAGVWGCVGFVSRCAG